MKQKKTGMKQKIILETERLYLRRLTQGDFRDLCKILQDEEAMYAYEHAFSDGEVHEWLDRQLARYEDYDFGLWAVTLKETGELIGQCGITKQDCDGEIVAEIGYLFQRAFWHQGYAAEAALACKRYGFETLGIEELYSIIRPENTASCRVAEKNGMRVKGQFTKHYYNMDMPHLIYSVKKPSWDKYDASRRPGPEEIGAYVDCSLWEELLAYMEEQYQLKPVIEYSGCSAAPGWNIKYKKAGRGLCTLYPEQGGFTVLVVIGEREREQTEGVLPSCTEYIRNLYLSTKVGMGQRWLMIDVRDWEILEDVKTLISMRRQPGSSPARRGSK